MNCSVVTYFVIKRRCGVLVRKKTVVIKFDFVN